MKIIPHQPYETNSAAEYRVFDKLKESFVNSNEYVALHSLNLIKHQKNALAKLISLLFVNTVYLYSKSRVAAFLAMMDFGILSIETEKNTKFKIHSLKQKLLYTLFIKI